MGYSANRSGRDEGYVMKKFREQVAQGSSLLGAAKEEL
jgi:hypothetical protein